MLRVLSTGNEELDTKIGGGFPYPTLIVIEGDHGTGKTALSQQFLLGALKSGIRAVVFTSESRPRDYVVKAEASGFPLPDYYIRGSLRVFSMQYPGPLDQDTANELAERLRDALHAFSEVYEFFVVDSLSYIASMASPSIMNEVVVTMKSLVVDGKGVIVTVHPKATPQEVLVKLAGTADGFLKISPAVVGGRRLKVLSIVKLKGAPPGIETTITFDVDPAFGIKLVPIMVSQS